MFIWLQTATAFWLGGGTISLSCCMYVGLIMLGRQTRTAELLMPEQSAFEIELLTENLRSHKSPSIDQIPAELIKAWVEQFAMRSINLLFQFSIKRNSLNIWRSRSMYLPIRRAIKQIVVIIEVYLFCQHSFIQHSTVKLQSICRESYWESSMWMPTQRVNYWWHRFSIRPIIKKKLEYNKAVHRLFIDSKKVYYSVRREYSHWVCYPMKLVSLIKLYLTEKYSTD